MTNWLMTSDASVVEEMPMEFRGGRQGAVVGPKGGTVNLSTVPSPLYPEKNYRLFRRPVEVVYHNGRYYRTQTVYAYKAVDPKNNRSGTWANRSFAISSLDFRNQTER